ncbi:MAG TPA: hypothetical protein PLZ77_06655, partial [Lachnospiraceae bacterium]|nr:hypothetical protein [Lachnospiraceae bacterium]
MNSIKNSSQLKSSARKYLSGHYSQVVLAQLFFIAFSALLSMLSATDPTATIVSVVISFVISYICTCNIEILRFGLYRMYMNLCCGYRFSVRDMYYGFFVKTQRPTFLAVLLTSIQYLSMLPFYILLFLYTASKDTFLLTATIISFLIGIFVYYILSLALSQSYFLLLDFPDKPLKEILKLS